MNPHSTPENEGAASSEPQPGQDLWARGASGAQTHAKPAAPAWERDVLERLVFATVSEQRSARRWRIFWRFLWVILVVGGCVVCVVLCLMLFGVNITEWWIRQYFSRM